MASGYPGRPYWELEEEKSATIGRLQLGYFPNAGKLQVREVFWDGPDGLKVKKVVTMDVQRAANEPKIAEILSEFLGAVAEARIHADDQAA